VTTSRLVWASLLSALCVPVGLKAQTADNTTATVQAQVQQVQIAGVVVPKPVRQTNQIISNDTIALLAVRRPVRMLPPETLPTASPTAVDESTTTDASARRAAEIAALDTQVREKRKRIALLLKLFVDDEKEFLKNGGAAEANPAAQERRRYEQDELRWETAELAKMTARLEQLKDESKK